MNIHLPTPQLSNSVDVAAILGASTLERHDRSRCAALEAGADFPAVREIATAWIRFDLWTDELLAIQNKAAAELKALEDEAAPSVIAAAQRRADEAERAYEEAIDHHEAFCEAVLGIEAPSIECALAKQRLFFSLYGATDALSLPISDAQTALDTLIADLEALRPTPAEGREIGNFDATAWLSAYDELGGVACKTHTVWGDQITHEALVFAERSAPTPQSDALVQELSCPAKHWAVYLAAPSMPGTSSVPEVQAALAAVGRDVRLITHPMAINRSARAAAKYAAE